MPTTKIDSAANTDMTNNVTSVTVAAAQTETTNYPEWNNPKWATWYGYYNKVPDLKAIINAKATWTVGKGYDANPATKTILNKLRGNGKDTFTTILQNNVKSYTIGGDSFAEIVRNGSKIVNLKPINPNRINIRGNSRGIIARYDQTLEGKIVNKFKPEEMFHLAWDRNIDEIHGSSSIEAIEDTILSFNEAYADMKIVFHRYVKPLIISSVDTDDEIEIAAYKAKLDKAVENGENLVVPKGTLDKMERMSIPQYSTLDPIPWIQQLQRRFIIANGVPEIILGHGADATEATSKIIYLAFQQMVEGQQMFLEEQIKAQLDLDIKLKFPASIEPAAQEDFSKERNPENMQMKFDKKK